MMHTTFLIFTVVACSAILLTSAQQCQDGDLSEHPTQCDNFYQCANAKQVIMYCPAGLVFNTEEKYCDWIINVPRCASFNDLCKRNPCNAAEKCIQDHSFSDHKGYNCTPANQTNPCHRSPYPCIRGECVAQNSTSYFCRCPPGYTGVNCMTPIDYCSPNPCANGGSCRTSWIGVGHVCSCREGYIGRNCETETIKTNPCQENPCIRGECIVMGATSYRCQCPPGYTGVNCQTLIEEGPCNPNPCNRGKCTALSRYTYTCSCPNGYQAANCDTVFGLGQDYCASNPCVNGECMNTATNYSCLCPPGFQGPTCA